MSVNFESDYAAGVASPLQIAWRRKALVLLGLVSSLAIGTLYYAKSPPVYSSTAQILVVKKQPDAVPVSTTDGRMAVMEDYLAPHTTIIRSPEVIRRAAKFLPPEGLKSTADGQDPMGVIGAALGVTREMKENSTPTNILILSGRSAYAEDSLKILNAVIKGYKEFLDETFQTVSDQTLELITQARDTLQGELKTNVNAYREFRREAPLLSRTAGTAEHQTLKEVQSTHLSLSLRKAEIENRLEAIDKAFRDGGKEAALDAYDATAPKGERSLDKLEEALIPDIVKLKELEKQFGANHPQVTALNEKIQHTREAYRAQIEAAQTGGGKRDSLEEKLRLLRRDLFGINTQLKLYDGMLDAEVRKVRTLTQYELEERELQRNIDRTQQLYEVIIKRLSELDLAKNQGGYDARVITPAAFGAKIAPVAWQVFGGALVVGLGLGLALAYLAEYTDTIFHTPEEVQRLLVTPVIGHVPVLEQDATAVARQQAGEPVPDPMLCTYYAPKSTRAEAFRGIRTSLYFSTHGSGHQVVQVTSPNAADGKSTVAANLAVSIAQSGKRTVLIDADFRRPRVHRLFGVHTDRGLATAINGDCTLDEAIQPSGVPGLWVVPCGPRPQNPAELLTAPRFQELLQEIRKKFDFVVIDTPPVLVVTDPCVVAPRVDGVILTLRLARNVRPAAERARDVFASLGANVLGVVINGVGDGRQVYGYSTYQYGHKYQYKYDYTYGYDYSYEYNDNYYSSDDRGAGPSGDAGPTAPAGAPTAVRRHKRTNRIQQLPFWRRLFN